MSNVPAQRSTTSIHHLGRATAVAAASSALLIGLSLPADAAEITPIAQYVDHTVVSTESELGGALSALGIHP